MIPAGTGMEYYRNVDIDRDETIGEAGAQELDEFPEILGGVEIPPSPHTAVATVEEAEAEAEPEAELELSEVKAE